jgi:diguanylate cyclase (GGDEF)-like protein
MPGPQALARLLRRVTLDINTLLVVTVANIVVLAGVSPAVMGRHLGPAANAARWSLIVHAAGWISMILANLWPESWIDRLLSTVSIAGFALTHSLMFKALGHWLGQRRFGRVVTMLAVLAPVGYFLVFDHYELRVGWANFLLSAQLALLVAACFRPQSSLHGPWRMVVAFGAFTMVVLTFGRGYLGAFTDLYPSFLTPHPWNVAAMFMTSLLPPLMNFAMLGGWHEEAEKALHQQAVTDSLTHLLNHRGWHEVARPLLANAHRHDLPLALLMLDIDHFKRINDSLGHEAGDRALEALGRLLHEALRASDVAARIGGEEFCLLLPGSDAGAAQQLDQRLRQQLPALEARLGHALDFSSGLALRQPAETLEALMARADTALYTAKQSGRGRLVAAEEQAPALSATGRRDPP